MRSPTVYTLGDSHALHGWVRVPNVVPCSAGPMLMYHYKHHPIIFSHIPKGAPVVLSWGEIDCRCHIFKHAPWDKTIDDMVDNYLSEIRKITDHHVILYNVVPPPRKLSVYESEHFPFLGSDDERLQFVTRVNLRLKQSGFEFMDVYDQFADKDGFLDISKSDNHVHIEDEKPLIEWLERRFENAPLGH